MEIHRELGHGLDERFYHPLLGRKLRFAGMPHESRARRELVHRGTVADVCEPDLAFPGRMIAELKCLAGAFAGEHFVQLLCYLKFWKIAAGLLFDFAKESRLYRRVEFREPVFEIPSRAEMANGQEDQVSLSDVCRWVGGAVRVVAAEYGLGYRDTIYTGLPKAERCHAGVECVNGLSVNVNSGDESRGVTTLPCLLVGQRLAVKVLALRRSITAAGLASTHTYLRLACAQIGLISNFDRSSISWRWVGAKTTGVKFSVSNPSPS